MSDKIGIEVEGVKESEKRFEDIALSMADWIWEVNENGAYTYCSERIKDILGYNREEVIGKTPFDLMLPEERDRIGPIFLEIVKNKRAIKDLENWNLTKDGKRVCLLTSGVPMLDAQGNLKGYRGVDKDITERKQIEKELEKAYKELKETTAQLVQTEKLSALGELTAGIAHEMNQPLNVIKITLQSFLRDINKGRITDPQAFVNDFQDIVYQVDRLGEIIDHMRVYTRRTVGDERQLIDVSLPIENIFKLIGQQLKVHNVEVIINMSHGLPKVAVETTKLEQVFMNLIINARDALESRQEGKKIEIRSETRNAKLETEGQEVVVCISDNGGGVPEEIRDKIFEPFFTTKESGKGTGLGLSLCHRMITEMNGIIELEVEEGVGSTFKVVLPAVKES